MVPQGGKIMAREYWLNLFSGKTWEEFLKNGANVSGFRESKRKTVEKIRSGDYLICYVIGISRFIGVLEAKSKYYYDETPLWEDEIFPCRVKVELIYNLDPKAAIPVHDLLDKLPMFKKLKSTKVWSGFFRGSPKKFKKNDAEITMEAIKNAVDNPVEKEFDERKYWRHPKTYESKIGVVTVPDEETEKSESAEYQSEKTTHEEIQWLLLTLGSNMGLDVWAARNDRNKEFNGNPFQDIPHMRNELPRQFDEVTSKTIEFIDVLWLQGDAIIAAFEVEHTSAIHSGLLRMSDLISMQPNIRINLYIVAPDQRREKVFSEINRPTFAKLKPPLPRICKFISYSELKKEIEQIGDRAKYMKYEFIEEIAESCEPDEL
jgi:predicted RNA-binding protein